MRINSGVALALAAASVALGACAAPAGRPDGAAALKEATSRLAAGRTTQAEALQALGPPAKRLYLRAEGREAWGYRYDAGHEQRMFWIEWSGDGRLHSTGDTPDFESRVYRGA